MKRQLHVLTILLGAVVLITASIDLHKMWSTAQNKALPLSVCPKKEYGVVDNENGWSELKLEPNAHSTVMAKILNGTNLEIIDKTRNWFKVSTDSGRVGYIFKDELILAIYEPKQ